MAEKTRAKQNEVIGEVVNVICEKGCGSTLLKCQLESHNLSHKSHSQIHNLLYAPERLTVKNIKIMSFFKNILSPKTKNTE